MKTHDLFGHEVPPASPSPSPLKPRTAWRDFTFEELLYAVTIGLPGASAAAARRVHSSVDKLDLDEARAEARRR